MKTFTVELEVGTKKAIKNIGDLEDEIERLSNELKGAEFGSKQFKELSQELIKAQKELKNTELSLEALDSEQVASEFGSVVGAVGDMTGAMVLLGGTGGAVEETAENIEKAIGISMAFKGAIEGVSSGMKLFNNIVKTNTMLQKANNTVTLLASAVMKTFTGSVNTTSVAFKGLRTAMISTGIGALVVGIGVLIANFDKLKDAISGINQAQRDRLDASNKAVENAEYEYELFKLQENSLRLQGKTDEQIQKMKLRYLRNILNAKMQELKIEKETNRVQLEAEQRNAQIAKTVVEIITWVVGWAPRLINMAIEEAATAVFSLFDLILEHPVAKMVLGDQGSFADRLLKSFKENFKPSTVLEEFIDEAEDWAVSLIFDPKATEEAAKDNLKELKKGIAQIESEMDGLMLSLQKSKEENSKLAKGITASTIDSNNKMVENTKSTLSVLRNVWAEHYKDQREQREKDLANEKAIMDARHQLQDALVAATSSSLQSIAELAGEGTKVAKAAALADIIITTGVGFAQGLDIAQKSAAGTGPGAAIAFPIFYATQIAAVLAMVVKAKNILSKVKAGPSPSLPTSAPSVGGTGSQAPQFNIVGQSGFNQIASALGQQPPVQAYVVAQDVTTAQQLQNNTIQTATF